MDDIDKEMDGGKELQRWNRVLSVFALLGIAWTIYLIGTLFFSSDFTIAMKTSSGIKLLTASDFNRTQRLVASVIILPPILCWMSCLFQVLRLSSFFSKGEILSIGVARCLELFGYGLAMQGIAESIQIPILSSYLIGQGIIDSVEGVWETVVGGGVLTSMLAAVLVVVIARILRIGIRLREDAELTI
jgi:Protein of unknown function (DUF2975)